MQSDGKIGALKTATKGLLDQLKAAATNNGDVYVSIVPFSKDVNVGSSNYSQSWINWSDWDAANGSYQGCSGWGWGGSGCDGWGWGGSGGTWTPSNHNTWNGCVTDRDQGYDVTGTAPTATAATKFVAEQYDSCPLAVKGLSYDWTAMKNLVDQMYPAGSTNQTIGLVWAWMSLTGGGPFTVPAKDPNYQYQDIIILMSDGMNTENRFSTSQSQIDKRMFDSSNNGAGTCANIKASGVTIFSVQVNTGGDPTSTVMKNCASTSDKFWMITSANDLIGVFQTIGTNLTQLRVAK
jgi:hypothetical protein